VSRAERVTRRQFLLLSAVFAVPLVPWRSLAGAAAGDRGEPRSTAERLAGLWRHRRSARLIGKAYLEVTPAEASARRLIDAIAEGLEGGLAAIEADPHRLRGALAVRIRRDFEEDRTIQLEGWILSRTEARLLGLAALVGPQRS
jgi:hypothetical protein